MKINTVKIAIVFFFTGCSPIKDLPVQFNPTGLEKKLIISADDFGASLNINEGIQIAADLDAITNISALTNFVGAIDQL